MTRQSLSDDVIDLLEEERATLLAADFAKLETLAQRKERAVMRLQVGRLAQRDLDRLVALSERNAVLLKAMMQAILDTKNLLLEGPKTPETWSYSATGKRKTLQPVPGVLAQKA
ncbi:MAG: hypothetical protein JXQ79_10840 [Rhodobacteraceae bacterium]|nr:hypothetical protein [Paracoccaceae bacterium]